MRLKTKSKRDDYPQDECAASRCHDTPTVTDATGLICKGDVPLCDRHWAARCDIVEKRWVAP